MNRKYLVEKLERVSLALAKDDLIPIFKCFAFTGDQVMACNDTLAITSPCQTEEAFCLHGPTLLGLLQNSHADAVELKIKDEDVVIKTGKSVFHLPWFPVEDYLWQPPDDAPDTKIVFDASFVQGMEECLLTVSSDATQLVLSGIYVKNSPKKGLAMYSSDGDAITRYLISAKTQVKRDYVMPGPFCASLVKVVKETEPKNITLVTTQEWAVAQLDSSFALYGRLSSLTNPLDHEAQIKRTLKHEPRFVPVPEGLRHALSRAWVVAESESAKTSLRIEGAKLYLATEASMGLVNDAVPYADKAYAVVASVSADRMQRCLSVCNEMFVADNCSVFRRGDELFIIASNLG